MLTHVRSAVFEGVFFADRADIQDNSNQQGYHNTHHTEYLEMVDTRGIAMGKCCTFVQVAALSGTLSGG